VKILKSPFPALGTVLVVTMPRSGSIIAVSVGFHALTQPTFISGID